MEKKIVYILFMSHRSGEHGLTVHNTVDEVKAEVKTVVEIIKNSEGDEGEKESSYQQDLEVVEEITGDGDFGELSDTTWFDVFEREV